MQLKWLCSEIKLRLQSPQKQRKLEKIREHARDMEKCLEAGKQMDRWWYSFQHRKLEAVCLKWKKQEFRLMPQNARMSQALEVSNTSAGWKLVGLRNRKTVCQATRFPLNPGKRQVVYWPGRTPAEFWVRVLNWTEGVTWKSMCWEVKNFSPSSRILAVRVTYNKHEIYDFSLEILTNARERTQRAGTAMFLPHHPTVRSTTGKAPAIPIRASRLISGALNLTEGWIGEGHHRFQERVYDY